MEKIPANWNGMKGGEQHATPWAKSVIADAKKEAKEYNKKHTGFMPMKYVTTVNGQQVVTYWDRYIRSWTTAVYENEGVTTEEADYNGDTLGAEISHIWKVASKMQENERN